MILRTEKILCIGNNGYGQIDIPGVDDDGIISIATGLKHTCYVNIIKD